jgi:hypothetical protein
MAALDNLAMAIRATTAVFRCACAAALVLMAHTPAAADDLADFHIAVARAALEYHLALDILDTRSRKETSAAVSRFRHAWQDVIERFNSHRPAALADDKTLGATFFQVDARIVGALIVIDFGSREAARKALAPIADTLTDLSRRTAPY